MELNGMVQYRATAYVRLSKEDMVNGNVSKSESNSITNQKQLIQDYVKDKADIRIVSIREDDGYTGTDYDRPGFQHMMDDIRAGIVNCVIVKDLSRFGREYINAGKYIDRLFPCYGVRLIAINDGIDTITQNSSDHFNITIKNMMNDNYCRDISIKIRSQLQVKRKNGEFVGAFAPYGYKKSDENKNLLVIDPYAADVVQDIFSWKLDGMSQDTISKRLNEMGVLSPMEYKKTQGLAYSTAFKVAKQAKWTPVAVRRILTNPVYTGTLVQGVSTHPNYKLKTQIIKDKSEWCIVENAHEAIISQKTFLLVKRLLELDTRTSPNEEKVYPLAGLIRCGDCNDPMLRKLQVSGKKRFSYYVCRGYKNKGGCSSHIISAELVENTVLQLLQEHIKLIIELDSCVALIDRSSVKKISVQKTEDRLTAIETEIERYTRMKTSAYEDMKDGLLSPDDYSEICEQYNARMDEAMIAKNQLRNEMDRYLGDGYESNTWIQDFIEHRNIRSLTRRVAVECIELVRVYEDQRIEVTFTHSQDYQELLSLLENCKQEEVV